MKSILLSVQPKRVEKILNGEKTIEIRKTAPKEVPFKVYVYCTKDRRKNYFNLVNHYGQIMFAPKSWDNILNGKVVAKFVVRKVDTYDYAPNCYNENEKMYYIKNGELDKTRLTYDELVAYGKGKALYGWHISDLKVYDEPLELKEFYKPLSDKDLDEGNYDLDCFGEVLCMGQPEGSEYCQDCEYGGAKPITRPPQSWQYVRRR